MTDPEFLHAFESCTLTRAQWTHEAHVRMAWLYLTREPFELALPKIRGGIQRLNIQVLKNHTGYHETITVVYARLIAERVAQSPAGATFSDFSAAHPEMLDHEGEIFFRYYRKETVHSQRAREQFVEPDLAPLPPMPFAGPSPSPPL